MSHSVELTAETNIWKYTTSSPLQRTILRGRTPTPATTSFCTGQGSSWWRTSPALSRSTTSEPWWWAELWVLRWCWEWKCQERQMWIVIQNRADISQLGWLFSDRDKQVFFKRAKDVLARLSRVFADPQTSCLDRDIIPLISPAYRLVLLYLGLFFEGYW